MAGDNLVNRSGPVTQVGKTFGSGGQDTTPIKKQVCTLRN